jgi:hypothetical protein
MNPNSELVAMRRRLIQIREALDQGRLTPDSFVQWPLDNEAPDRQFGREQALDVRARDAALRTFRLAYKNMTLDPRAEPFESDVRAALSDIRAIPPLHDGPVFGKVSYADVAPNYAVIEAPEGQYALRGFGSMIRDKGLEGHTALAFSAPAIDTAPVLRLAPMSERDHAYMYGALVSLSGKSLPMKGQALAEPQLFAEHVHKDENLTVLFKQIDDHRAIQALRVRDISFDVQPAIGNEQYLVDTIVTFDGQGSKKPISIRSGKRGLSAECSLMYVAQSLTSSVDEVMTDARNRFPEVALGEASADANRALNHAIRQAGNTRGFFDQHLRRDAPGIAL